MINNISLFDSVNMLCKNKYLGELFELRGHDRPCLPDLDNASGGNVKIPSDFVNSLLLVTN